MPIIFPRENAGVWLTGGSRSRLRFAGLAAQVWRRRTARGKTRERSVAGVADHGEVRPYGHDRKVDMYPMAFGLNRVELIGRLGADVTVNQLMSGGRVANLSIATDESYINKSRAS